MKKISIMLLICSLMCFSLPVYAQDTIDSEIVTYEEMAAAVEAIGDEYGIDLKLTKYIPLTREEAQIELEYYRNSSAAISENQNFFRDDNSLSTDAENTLSNTEPVFDIAPQFMEITKTKDKWFQFQNLFSIAEFNAVVTVTMDADRNYIVTVDKVTVDQLGVATNFREWVPGDIIPYKNQPSKGFVTVNVQGITRWGLSGPGGTQGTYSQRENTDVIIDFT